ncbi:formyl transferase [Roseovarius sp. ZX-A-9]|uniref:formyl transferase n=1 Tax=Roseovarius sp. ZX-A-9 TaxID=3014783 RepID=UPI002330F34A|nr:formyl transferase [Roseovarius sp. ZX-A-9]
MKLVILATSGTPTDILVNYLDDSGLQPIAVLIEPAQSRTALLRGRARRLGWRAVVGQVLFMALVLPVLRRRADKRLASLRKIHSLRADPLPESRVTSINSVNSDETREILRRLAPDAVVLSGTRIVKSEALRAADAPVLNIHAGITPEFRGVHGGYWALWSGQPQDFGATLHVVDAGVDTGAVLEHIRPTPEPQDSFVTYPLIQLATALPALVRVLNDLGRGLGLPEAVPTSGQGRQWYHPTIAQYLTGLWRGVR